MKVFGYIAIVFGVLNIGIAIAMMINDVASSGGTTPVGKIMFGIGCLLLGVYLIRRDKK